MASVAEVHPLIQIGGVPKVLRLRPSQFNSRATAPDGTLILYNSLTGAFTGFPKPVVPAVLALLPKAGRAITLQGLAKYMWERGYLVESSVNELDRSRQKYA